MTAAARMQATLRSQDRPVAEPDTLLTDNQRRVMLGMLAAGVAYLLVGLLVPPSGVGFWMAFIFAPPLLGVVAALVGGVRGRRLDAWLLAGGRPKQAAQPVAPAALPEAARDTLRVAMVPAVLADLARAGAGMPEAEKAAAGRLLDAAVAAWNAAADHTARLAVARALPPLVAGLAAGGAEAIRAADGFARTSGAAR
jgi:hypothetical protein